MEIINCNKMKILTIGDLHGDLTQARKLADVAEKEKVDLVLFSGDFTISDIHTDGLMKVFKDKNLKLALIPGNHESPATADALAAKYGAINLHGYATYFGDLGIFGCGAANVGIFQLPEPDIFDLLKYGFNKIKDKKKKLMVTHVHPENIMMSKFSDVDFGSTAVTKAIYEFKPDIAICSHLHEAESLEEQVGNTKVINVGKEGKIIEL
jgi:Icc-related predicted phosphoesterase